MSTGEHFAPLMRTIVMLVVLTTNGRLAHFGVGYGVPYGNLIANSLQNGLYPDLAAHRRYRDRRIHLPITSYIYRY